VGGATRSGNQSVSCPRSSYGAHPLRVPIGVLLQALRIKLSLAHGIQATLVPTISFQNASFELYGKSIPSTEMGGDLIDVIESDGGLVAFVADISGHGLPAGQLMGM
jgi:serine phosphatase RsbU (regulator of sigma subunit)